LWGYWGGLVDVGLKEVGCWTGVDGWVFFRGGFAFGFVMYKVVTFFDSFVECGLCVSGGGLVGGGERDGGEGTLFSSISSVGYSRARALRILFGEMLDRSESLSTHYNSRVSCGTLWGKSGKRYVDCGYVFLHIKRGHFGVRVLVMRKRERDLLS
jgi:hypothetical protein